MIENSGDRREIESGAFADFKRLFPRIWEIT